jgi:uncharacterized protein
VIALSEIKFLEYKKVNLKGSTLVDGMPSSGLGSTILANYIVGQRGLDQVAAVDCEDFPPVSMIYDAKPKFPARIYASEADRLAVILSELKLHVKLDRSMAKSIISWVKQQNCNRIVTSQQLPLDKDTESEYNLKIYGVGSTDGAREQLKNAGIEQLQMGMITGIPGILLNEGRWQNFDVCVVVVFALPDTANIRIAATLIDPINKLMPNVEIDVKPLVKQAEEIEERLKVIRRQAQPVVSSTPKLYT